MCRGLTSSKGDAGGSAIGAHILIEKEDVAILLHQELEVVLAFNFRGRGGHSGCARACWNMVECFRALWSMLGHPGACWEVPEAFSRTFWNILEHYGIFLEHSGCFPRAC